MEREEVYKVVDTEREYQIAASKDLSRPDMIEKLSVAETLTAIRYNLQKADEEWYKNPSPHIATMEYLRKIAALCVQAGENYGMIERFMPPHYNIDKQ